MFRSTNQSFFSHGGVQQVLINLEETLTQEAQLFQIFSSLKNKIANFPQFCYFWWGSTEKQLAASYSGLFKDEKHKLLAN